MAKWQKIETAPRDGTEIRAKIPGYGGGNVIAWQFGFVDSNEEECGCWVVADGFEPPPSWTDGVCWEINEDGEPSVQPTHWKPVR